MKQYRLRPYSGPNSRTTCPQCGRGRCFTPYVDEDGQVLHLTVGRCDHESKCGYHYSPRDWYRDNPTKQPSWTRPASTWRPTPTPPKRIDYIDWSEMYRYQERLEQSTLLQFLVCRFQDKRQRLIAVANAYGIGADDDGWTIYPQIDAESRLRTAKSMLYGSDGHRVKGEQADRINWMHSHLKAESRLPLTWQLTQCLFGEHLLHQRPDAYVCIVEAEKTAWIAASLFDPDKVWVATGGKQNLRPEVCKALAGRRVLAYPDADAVDLTRERVKALTMCRSIRVVDWYVNEPEGSHRDIADIILAAR